jgi:predicted DNA-binding protein
MFEDNRPDERLVLFAVDLLVKAGRTMDAQSHLWRAFGKEPSLELYARLRKLGGKTARERAVRALEARLAAEERTRWHFPADLLIRILMHEKMLEAAWAVVRTHGASRGVKKSLAGMSEATYPREAIEVYAERVEELANVGGNPAYAEAAALIARMATLRGATEHTAYIAGLKERFGRKRNFMKLLG